MDLHMDSIYINSYLLVHVLVYLHIYSFHGRCFLDQLYKYILNTAVYVCQPQSPSLSISPILTPGSEWKIFRKRFQKVKLESATYQGTIYNAFNLHCMC